MYLCARVWENPLTGEVLDVSASGGSGSVVKAANLVELHADGSATLADGTCLPGVDTVMYCTGYDYSFPFLQPGGASGSGFVSVQDNRVGPLYQHVFPPAAAPTLSFIGLPWKVVPFPQFELQARWIARVLAGAALLPPREVRHRVTAGSKAKRQTGGHFQACATPPTPACLPACLPATVSAPAAAAGDGGTRCCLLC